MMGKGYRKGKVENMTLYLSIEFNMMSLSFGPNYIVLIMVCCVQLNHVTASNITVALHVDYRRF